MRKNTILQPMSFFDLSRVFFAEIFTEIDYVWEPLKEINNYIAGVFNTGKLKPNYGKDIFVGEGTTIEEGVLVKGPAIIGERCFVGHGAYLREGCLIADNVRIGHGTEIKNSILLSKATAAHLNYIGDSIIGRDVNMGGGAKTANFRLDGKAIRVKLGDEFFDTGLVKFGAIVGDGSKIGVNAVLNPGTILGKNCLVYPLTSVIGIHKEGSIIK